MSMTLDLACLALVVLAAVGGAFAGAVPQLAHIAAVLAGWAGARALGPSIAPLLQGRVPAFAAHPIAGVIAFVGSTMAATLAARLLIRLTPLRHVPGGRVDRGLGAVLGGVQALLVLWVALSAFAVWNRPLQLGSFVADPARSDLVAFARENNAFGSAQKSHIAFRDQAFGSRARVAYHN
jgi:uncharacterized membrane protein required for colicin V production